MLYPPRYVFLIAADITNIYLSSGRGAGATGLGMLSFCMGHKRNLRFGSKFLLVVAEFVGEVLVKHLSLSLVAQKTTLDLGHHRKWASEP